MAKQRRFWPFDRPSPVESVTLTGMPFELLYRINNRPQDGFDADEHRGAPSDIWPAQSLKP